MNPSSTVHELERMLKEIRLHRELRQSYYSEMMLHLNRMCILSLLEFSSNKIRNANLDSMDKLIRLCRSTKHDSN